MTSGRRVGPGRVRLVGRPWNDVVRELESFLNDLLDANDNGIPPGFLDTTPETITPDSAGDGGTETAGWAAADHDHPISTAAPTNATGTAGAEGSATSFLRSDATVKQGIVTTKGDVLGHSTVPARVPIGTDGHVLTADSTETLGLKWAEAAADSGWVDDGTVVRLETATDQVGIGTATPTAGDTVEVIGPVGIARHDNDATDGATLNFRRSRDTEASPDAILDDDIMGIVYFYGASDDGMYYAGATLHAEASANWTGSGGKGTDFQTDLVMKIANPSVLEESFRFRSGGVLEANQITVNDNLDIGPSIQTILSNLERSNDGQFTQETAAGASKQLNVASEEITIAAATSDSIASLLPANAIIRAVTAYVTEDITRATTPITDFDVGDPTTAQRFATGVASTTGSNAAGLRQWRGSVSTDATGAYQTSADMVRITCNGGSGGFTAGKVHVVVFYETYAVGAP